MKKLLFFSFIFSLIFGCSENSSNQSDNAPSQQTGSQKTSPSDSSFFPVTGYLITQARLLDSMQVTFLQVNTNGDRSDSLWIPREKIRSLLQPFFEEVIDKNNLMPFFRESKFIDQSTEAITLTYDPKALLPDSISIRHWDIYINPETETIKRIYILRQSRQNEGVYTQQLTWQTGKWAKLVTILNKPNGSSEIKSDIKIQWDFKEL